MFMYAVVATGGKQYKVEEGDVLEVEKLEGEAGSSVELPVVMLGGDSLITDTKKLEKATVSAEIVDQFKDDKVIIFKFKKRKGYKRTRGHRQNLTRLRITKLSEA
jgi:large subunit ribosomal protein L21